MRTYLKVVLVVNLVLSPLPFRSRNRMKFYRKKVKVHS